MLRSLLGFAGGLVTLFIVMTIFLLLTSGAAATYSFLKLFIMFVALMVVGLAGALTIFLGVQIGFSIHDEFFKD